MGMVLPSFVIIYAISLFLDGFLEIALVANAFRGIRVGVGVVILNAGVNMLRKAPKDRLSRIILLCGLGAMLAASLFSLKISSITLMLLAGMVSLAVFCVKGGAGK